MRYTELKTWEDFAKALSQEQNPARLTYLVEGLNRALRNGCKEGPSSAIFA